MFLSDHAVCLPGWAKSALPACSHFLRILPQSCLTPFLPSPATLPCFHSLPALGRTHWGVWQSSCLWGQTDFVPLEGSRMCCELCVAPGHSWERCLIPNIPPTAAQVSTGTVPQPQEKILTRIRPSSPAVLPQGSFPPSGCALSDLGWPFPWIPACSALHSPSILSPAPLDFALRSAGSRILQSKHREQIKG